MAGGTDHLLLDTVRRRLRHPGGWVVVALRLSELAAPAPRPHHRRIARVLMDDTARRHDGTVFPLSNGDMVLLCRAHAGSPPATGLRIATPAALPEVLSRLLRADAPDARELIGFWPLETSGDRALSYAMAGAAAVPRPPSVVEEARSLPTAVDTIATALDGADVIDLMHRRTAVVIGEQGMRPLFREIRFSRAALEARVAPVARADSDPFLFRHLAERLDQRMIGLIHRALGGNGALDPAVAGTPRLHLNLTLPTLRSDGFVRLAEGLLARGLSLGVEISLLDACADPERFEQASGALRRLGMLVVLDGVTRQALALARVAALRPDLVKLAWAPRMVEDEPPQAGEALLLRDLGPDRVVLHHAETEAALRWGLRVGIRRFQGRHVESMLGAMRLSDCASARLCTLRQCMDRAAATAAGGRQGCLNRTLLDAGAPPLPPLPLPRGDLRTDVAAELATA